MKLLSHALLLFSAAALMSTPTFAQQDQGDKEIGLTGIFLVQHKPVTGFGTLIGSYGNYIRRSQYIGVSFGPSFTFGNGSNDVTGTFNANYRYLMGGQGAKYFPFVGALAGGNVGSNSTQGYGGAEVGFKTFVSQKVSFELAYQFNVNFKGGGGNFLNRTNSQVVLGFKYIL